MPGPDTCRDAYGAGRAGGAVFRGGLGPSLRVCVFPIAGFADAGCRKNPRNTNGFRGSLLYGLRCRRAVVPVFSVR